MPRKRRETYRVQGQPEEFNIGIRLGNTDMSRNDVLAKMPVYQLCCASCAANVGADGQYCDTIAVGLGKQWHSCSPSLSLSLSLCLLDTASRDSLTCTPAPPNST